MSQIAYEEVCLAELLEASDLVLVVSPLQPPTEIEEIPIPLLEPALDGTERAVYHKVSLRYRVEQVLLDETGGGPAPGDEIAVLGAHWRQELASNRAYYQDGISESPIYRHYQGHCGPDATEAIVFLARDRSELAFAIDGGVESLDQRPAVLEALARRPPRFGVLEAVPPVSRPTGWRTWFARLFGR
jgi:hypothetical protein